MPIGVITAFIGAPTLIVLIRRRPYLYGGGPVSLELQGLSVDIGGRRIVADVDVDRRPTAQFVGLLGPNGSGKSTILKAIYRVHRPAAGRVLLDGVDLLALPAQRRRPPGGRGGPGDDRRVRLHRLRDGHDRPHPAQAGLRPRRRHRPGDRAPRPSSGSAATDLADRSFNTLSGGEKQRVLIARAHRPGRRPPHPGRADQPSRHPLPGRGARTGRRARRHGPGRPARPEPGRAVLRHRLPAGRRPRRDRRPARTR